MSIFSDIEAFITTKVWPFLKNIGKATVQAEIANLTPIAVSAVAEAEADVVSAAASGSLANLGTTLGALVTKTAVKAEATGITAGATSILASVASSAVAMNGPSFEGSVMLANICTMPIRVPIMPKAGAQSPTAR